MSKHQFVYDKAAQHGFLSTSNQPGWYCPVLAITVLPSILLGEWLYVRGIRGTIQPTLAKQNL